MTTIKSFVERLAKIGIKVELSGNYPWVYLDKVNGKKVWGKYLGNHGFTVFWYPNTITDIPIIFQKIREMLCERVGEYEVYRPADKEEPQEYPEVVLFNGTEDQCKRWIRDYDDVYEECLMRKVQNHERSNSLT